LELQINLEYRIKTDPLNIILEKRRIAKKGASEGKEVWEAVGNYPGVQAIITAIERSTQTIKESLSESNIKILEKQLRKVTMENELLKKQLNKEDKSSEQKQD
jgi:hypothetical protein